MARILVGCEVSGVVRDAFIAEGHDAVSCDTLPSDRPGPHFQGNVLNLLSNHDWDMMICFPPCTHLCSSGARWFKDKQDEQREALSFVSQLLYAPIERICLENPVGIISNQIKRPSQYVEPWWFGHGYTKKTGLWLKGLPDLTPTNVVAGRSDKIHKAPETKARAKIRSETPSGLAEAMARQWGPLL